MRSTRDFLRSVLAPTRCRVNSAGLCLVLSMVGATAMAEVTLIVSDPDGVAASARAPVSVAANLKTLFGDDVKPGRLRLVELTSSGDRARTAGVPVQFIPGASHGTLWWLMPPGPKGERRFRLTIGSEPGEPEPAMRISASGKHYDVSEGTLPVLRYNHGSVPVPEGTKKHFIEGESYERGDYIHPMYGPTGEVLTDDYPHDHPHHRGVWWTWPLTRWGEKIGDIWAVVQVHARPVGMRAASGDVMALLEAENVWKWADGTPIVREEVTLRAFRQTGPNRYVDVDLRLTGLVDDVAIGGRPGRGYGGFAVRFVPGEDQQIVVHGGPDGATRERAWVDYSSVLPGSSKRIGIALFEHPTNPGYPSEIHEYANLNCVMAAFPGDREVLLPKDKPLELRQRMWIRSGHVDEETLSEVWAAYAQPPAVSVVTD